MVKVKPVMGTALVELNKRVQVKVPRPKPKVKRTPIAITKARKGTDFRGFEKYELEKCQLAEAVLVALYERHPDKTIPEIAKVAQVGESTLSNLTSGKTLFPRLDTLWKMASGAGLKIHIHEQVRTPIKAGK